MPRFQRGRLGGDRGCRPSARHSDAPRQRRTTGLARRA